MLLIVLDSRTAGSRLWSEVVPDWIHATKVSAMIQCAKWV